VGLRPGPGAGTYVGEALISLTEVREVHRRALDRVWAIAPNPDATDREAPGGFREHAIHHPFSGGMAPPPWPDVPAQVTTLVDDVNNFGADVARRNGPGARAAHTSRSNPSSNPDLGARPYVPKAERHRLEQTADARPMAPRPRKGILTARQ
jgi:hypothetical protein